MFSDKTSAVNRTFIFPYVMFLFDFGFPQFEHKMPGHRFMFCFGFNVFAG